MKESSLLFVCTGNICRSVMAEGFLKDLVQRDGAALRISSAGVFADAGDAPPRDVVGIMAERGVDVSGHRSKPLSNEDIVSADLLITMAIHQSRKVFIRAHELGWKVFTLKEFVVCAEGLDGEAHGEGAELAPFLHRLRGPEGLSNLLKDSPEAQELLRRGELDENFVQRFLHLHHHIYEDLSVDDPIGQSRAFMGRCADEIEEYVGRLYRCLTAASIC